MSVLDHLQQAWQSQRCATPAMNPDSLLSGIRLERRVHFWSDMFVISVLLAVGAWMLRFAVRDIHKGWPWLIYVASDAWVIGFILFNRWRRRRDAAHYDDSVLAHVEWSIKEIEHRMRLDRYSLWWYVLPIALGCMIPPVLFFAIDFSKDHEWGRIFVLLRALSFFAAVFIFVHMAMKCGVRLGLEGRRRELQALRALRESLLNAEE
jgi:hypothetical protein